MRASRPAPLAIAALGAALVALGAGGPRVADAQSRGCEIRGTTTPKNHLAVFSAGGDTIAQFTGQPLTVTTTLTDSGRAGVKTGGGFRVDGFVDRAALTFFTSRNVPVADGHVWVAAGRPVHVGGSGGQAEIELRAGSPVDQTVKVVAPCDAVTFERPTVTPRSPDGNSRGYVMKRAPLAVHGEPGGATVFTFTEDSAIGHLLFWSTEKKGNEVHVLHVGDLIVDGWVAASDLDALKVGEMQDELHDQSSTISTPKLALQGAPRTARATSEVVLRQRADETALKVGAVEAGGEVIFMETIGVWSNVVPSSLAILPPEGGGGFWVKTSELAGSGPPSK